MGPINIALVGCKEIAQLYVPMGMQMMRRVEMMRSAGMVEPVRLTLPIVGGRILNLKLEEPTYAGDGVTPQTWLIGPDGNIVNMAQLWGLSPTIILYYLSHGIFRPVRPEEDAEHYRPPPPGRNRVARVDLAYPMGIQYQATIVAVEYPPLYRIDSVALIPGQGSYVEATIIGGMRKVLVHVVEPRLVTHLGYFPGPEE